MLNWLRRDEAVGQPHYLVDDLVTLDDRLEAQLDGVLIAENNNANSGWSVCLRELEKWQEPGEVFVATWLAIKANNADWFGVVLEYAAKSRECARAIASAIGWLPFEEVKECIDALLLSPAHELRTIGIAASAIHRHDPGTHLEKAINDTDAVLRARALRAVGELARRDLLENAREKMDDNDCRCRFSAACTVARLDRDTRAVEILKDVASNPRNYDVQESMRALQLVLRIIDADDGITLAQQLLKNEETERLGMIGLGIVGTPDMPSILEWMTKPSLARLAGEAFSMITGVDLAYDDLDGEWPEGIEAGPTEDPADSNVAMDPDENLPWPNPALLQHWWQTNKDHFQPGIRYLCGQQIGEEICEVVLRQGFQRQRTSAALELALMRPAEPIFNVKAPAKRQKKLLGLE